MPFAILNRRDQDVDDDDDEDDDDNNDFAVILRFLDDYSNQKVAITVPHSSDVCRRQLGGMLIFIHSLSP